MTRRWCVARVIHARAIWGQLALPDYVVNLHQPQATSDGRTYDPALGRFLQPDPVVAGTGSQSFNRFSYALNNPLRFTDPSGHYEIEGEDETGCPVPARKYSLADLYRRSGVQVDDYGNVTSELRQDWYESYVGMWNGEYGVMPSGRRYSPSIPEEMALTDARMQAQATDPSSRRTAKALTIIIIAAKQARGEEICSDCGTVRPNLARSTGKLRIDDDGASVYCENCLREGRTHAQPGKDYRIRSNVTLS